MRLRFLVYQIVIVAFFLSGPSFAAEEPICTQQLETKCLECHYETRICQKLKKKKSTRSWKRIIKKMVKHGAEVNKEDKQTLAKCLSQPPEDLLRFCGQ